MIESNGGSSSYLTRTSGLIASTGAMTILGAFRRTADRNADSVVLELQSAGGGTVHTVATSGNGDRLRLYANWASQLAESTFDFTDAQIVMIALRGNGTTLSLSVSTNLGGSWSTVSVTQTVFTPAAMFVLNNDRGEPFHGGVLPLGVRPTPVRCRALGAGRFGEHRGRHRPALVQEGHRGHDRRRADGHQRDRLHQLGHAFRQHRRAELSQPGSGSEPCD